MTPRAPRDTVPRCPTCGWQGKTTTAGLAAHALRIHSCAKKQRDDATHSRGLRRHANLDRTPKPCAHKHANHQHGTRACYVLDRCRCLPCAVANAAAEQQRVREHAYGRWDHMVGAQPVREHVAALEAAGVGLKQITRLTGVSGGTLWKLMYGKHGQPPSTRVRRDTAGKLLALQARTSLAPGAKTDPTGTRRRLQALVACGWSIGQLSARSGLDRQRLDGALKGRGVLAGTATRVRDLYDQLWDQPPPECDHRSRIAAARSRNRARAQGWPPPVAWDDDTIDDPAATPAVAPIGEGRRDRVIHPDDVEWLIRAGGTRESIAARLGVTWDSVCHALRKAGRQDLIRAAGGQVVA